jgi:O-antigen ligase
MLGLMSEPSSSAPVPVTAPAWAPWVHAAFWGLITVMIVAQAPATKPALQIGVGILGLLGLGLTWKMGMWAQVPRLAVGFCGALLVFIGLSAIFGAAAAIAQHDFIRWLLVFSLGIFLITYAKWAPLPTQTRWLCMVAAMIVGALFLGIADLTQYRLQNWYKPEGFEATDFNKPYGVLAMIAPALLMPLWYMGGWRRWVVLGVALVLAMVILPSHGQAAVLSLLVCALAAVMPVRSRRFWKVVRVTTVVAILGLPSLMPFLFTTYAAGLKENPLTSKAAMAERLEIWAAMSERMNERPFLGYGYEAARVVPMPLQGVYFPDPLVAHPHNLVMQAWLEAGLVGALVMAVVFVLLWRRIEREKDRRIRRLYFMSVCGVVAFALVGWNMWQTWWVATLFLVIMLTRFSGRIIANHGFGQAPSNR